MKRDFVIKFNVFNSSLEKSICNGDYNYKIELIVTGKSYMIEFDDYYESKTHCTKTVPIEFPDKSGVVTIGCIYHFCVVGDQTYHYVLPPHVVDIDDQEFFTFNVYGYRFNENDISFIDFGPGEIPQRPVQKGCYVATCVYGSYDCPEVWTLRRFRDDRLSTTWYGRLFIKVYYAISPTFVKWFGKTKLFKNIFKPKLDKLVAKLNNDGVADTPYDDGI